MLATSGSNASIEVLVDATVRILTDRGPLTEEQIEQALADHDVDLDDTVSLDDVLDADEGELVVLVDGRWAALRALVAGRVFTHRVTGPELERDVLAVCPDFEAVMGLVGADPDRRLADGASVRHVLVPFDAGELMERGVPLDEVDEHGVLLLEPGYLRGRGCGEGDLVAFGLGPDGLRLDAVEASTGLPDALGRRLEAALGVSPDEPILLPTAVLMACADEPALFVEPLPPLGEVLDELGFPRSGEWLGQRGFDLARWRVAQRRNDIARLYDLDADEAFAVLAMAALHGKVRTAGVAEIDDVALRTVAPALAEPGVAEAVLSETIGLVDGGAEALEQLTEALEPVAPRAARPAVRWLRGKARERRGDTTGAEAEFEIAQALDPGWSPALVDLARYASDRGEADRGLALLRRAAMPPDHELVQLLTRFQTTPRAGIGRNEACWCGSGRKYKKCHLNNERAPLEERAMWLYRKAARFATDGRWRSMRLTVAQLRAQHSVSPFALLEALGDPLVTDAVLFEGGALAEFLAARGDLLPDDERLLAQQWFSVGRSAYEVERVRRGEGPILRDVRTGDVHQTTECAAGRALRPGQLVCARVLPAGETMQILGGIEPVALRERDELVALLDSHPNHAELVEFLSRPEVRDAELAEP